ncbi:1-acyl-sn-glycerol-3-phosphate acyltransferase [Myxococcota bacterium]|nr:1-acyl-sn-glycerol-3-phosphate acyltransferase [Myxococcota bacterium]MCZ7616988.1 1-acyl-sn-glycerol-3-phosphate acyltransferase [Myxococcota bacterium]
MSETIPESRAQQSGAPRPTRLVDWVFTLPFLIAFGAALVVFDPIQRLARQFGQRPQEIAVGALQATLVGAFHLCGTRLLVERAPELQPRTGYILIANHQSMFDIPILGALLFSNFPKYVSKQELARWIPSISYNLRRGGNAVIDRNHRQQAVDAIRTLGETAQARNVSVVIYPEGTRSRAGELRPFKPAGALALLATAPDLPVVPVTIDASWRLLARNLLPVPFGTRVRVRFGTPMARGDAEGPELLRRAREDIEATLTRWRSEDEFSAS